MIERLACLVEDLVSTESDGQPIDLCTKIDIIARDPQGTLVFVEVKATWTDRAGDPAFRVNKKKQRTIK